MTVYLKKKNTFENDIMMDDSKWLIIERAKFVCGVLYSL